MPWYDSLPCNEVMTWLRVMQQGEATKLVAPHLADCPTCRTGEQGLARLRRWVTRLRLGSTRADVLTMAIAGWCAGLTARPS